MVNLTNSRETRKVNRLIGYTHAVYGFFNAANTEECDYVANYSATIVKIGDRMYFYSVAEGVIRGTNPELSSMGFVPKGIYFDRPVNKSEIDSAFKVCKICVAYKGYEALLMELNEETGNLLILLGDADGAKLGIKPIIDYNDKCIHYYVTKVPDSEVTDIYEIRKPIEGFPFVSPEKVYHKKDGVWIPWHEMGTLLKEGEWI